MVFWPLVLLALLVRLSLGSVPLPSAVFTDPVQQLNRLSILCDTPAPSPDRTPHHHSGESQDECFVLSDALELPVLAGAVVLSGVLFQASAHGVWFYPPTRAPPLGERSSLCPQGPPL